MARTKQTARRSEEDLSASPSRSSGESHGLEAQLLQKMLGRLDDIDTRLKDLDAKCTTMDAKLKHVDTNVKDVKAVVKGVLESQMLLLDVSRSCPPVP